MHEDILKFRVELGSHALTHAIIDQKHRNWGLEAISELFGIKWLYVSYRIHNRQISITSELKFTLGMEICVVGGKRWKGGGGAGQFF